MTFQSEDQLACLNIEYCLNSREVNHEMVFWLKLTYVTKQLFHGMRCSAISSCKYSTMPTVKTGANKMSTRWQRWSKNSQCWSSDGTRSPTMRGKYLSNDQHWTAFIDGFTRCPGSRELSSGGLLRLSVLIHDQNQLTRVFSSVTVKYFFKEHSACSTQPISTGITPSRRMCIGSRP